VVEDILVVIIGRADVQQDSEVCFREENKRLEKDDSGILGFSSLRPQQTTKCCRK
jgi:hypothetical protein